MAHASSPQPAGPRPWVKWLVTLLILWQFFAILSIVTASGGNDTAFVPSVTVVQYVTKPYLEAVFLTNAYHFYAPNPGPIDLLWYRIEYENEAVRWFDMSDREHFANRMPFQRHVSLSMMIQQMSAPDPANPLNTIMSAQGAIAIQSYVRHVAQTKATVAPDGSANPVKEVDVYHLAHIIMVPKQIRMGWEPEDLRLYRATFFGNYDANGNRLSPPIDPEGTAKPYQTRPQPTSMLTFQILGETQANLEHEGLTGAARLEAASVKRLPPPIRKLIAKYPELLDPSPKGETPLDRLKRLVESRDDQEAKRAALRGIDYPETW